jgi:predicted MFS family arabinose efflux permease
MLSLQTGAEMREIVRWRVVALLACAGALNYADRTSLSVVFPLLRAELSLSDLELAAIGSFFLWSYAAASPLAGWVVDRYPRQRVITLSLLAWSLVTLLTALVSSPAGLLASRVLLGLSECFYLPAAIALIAGHHGPETRGRALALHAFGLNLGLVGGGALAGYLGQQYGWRSSLVVLGVLGIGLSLLCHFLLSEAGTRSAARRPSWSRLLGNRAWVLLAAQAALVSLGTWMFFNWMPLYFQERFSLTLAFAGFSGTAVLQLSAVFGLLIGGVMTDSIARRAGLQGRLLAMAVLYVLCAPPLAVFLSAAGFPLVAAGVVAFSFLKALAMANEPPALCEIVDEQDRGSAQSLMNMLNTLAGGIGVYVAGALKADWGLSGVFASTGLLILLSAVLTLGVRRASLRP